MFGLNTGKYGPEIIPYLETFHVVKVETNFDFTELMLLKFLVENWRGHITNSK